MAALVYVNNMSLDGFIEDPSGALDFFPVDEEVFASHAELLQDASTFLYGRRLYEAMAVWETDPSLAAQSAPMARFAAAWQAALKIVCSRTLTTVPTARTRIERHFDPAAVRELKATADGPIIIGGAHLAAQALDAGLVDQCLLYVLPVVLSGGKPALPTTSRVDLELIDQRPFANGVMLLRYRPVLPAGATDQGHPQSR